MTMDFSAYNMRDLQHFYQLLHQLEIAGVTDLRFARARLHQHLFRPQKMRPPRRRTRLPPKWSRGKCPHCGGMLTMVANDEGLDIIGCRLCRYSRIEGV